MNSYSNSIVTLSASEKASYIKNCEKLNELKSYVYIPDMRRNGYEYSENDSNNFCLPLGINENDKKYLPNSEFVLINDMSTNALSASIKNIPIIGLFIGSIIKIEHSANMMIGSTFENNFPIEKLKRPKIFINNEGFLEIKRGNRLLGYKNERIISYMTTETALRFLVLHEIGHHCKCHITKDCEGFTLLKANDKINSDFEKEADNFAAQKLAQEFHLLLDQLIKLKNDLSDFSKEEIERLALNIIITAMTLPFSILYQPHDEKIEGNIVEREVFAIMTLIAKLYKNDICRKAVIYDLRNKTDKEEKEIVEIIPNFEKIKASQTIDFSDFCQYIALMFSESKHLYYEVNQITNFDDYLENYFKVLASFKKAIIEMQESKL